MLHLLRRTEGAIAQRNSCRACGVISPVTRRGRSRAAFERAARSTNVDAPSRYCRRVGSRPSARHSRRGELPASNAGAVAATICGATTRADQREGRVVRHEEDPTERGNQPAFRDRTAAVRIDAADADAELAFGDLQPRRAAPAHAARAPRLLRHRRRGAVRSPAGAAVGARVRRRPARRRGRLPRRLPRLHRHPVRTDARGPRQGETALPRQDPGQRARPALHRQALSARALRRPHSPSGGDLELVRELVLRRRLHGGTQVQSDPEPLRPGDGALPPRAAGADGARRVRGSGAATGGGDAARVRVPRAAVRARRRSTTESTSTSPRDSATRSA